MDNNIKYYDSFIVWRTFSNEINLFEKFSLNEWNQIISGFTNNQEWLDYIQKYKNIINCYILYNRNTSKIIGFSIIIIEDYKKKICSFHGGGCSRGTLEKILYFRGVICLLSNIIKEYPKIRSACYKGNTKAYRFLSKIGFVKYYEMDDVYKFWINKKRLTTSSLYQRILINNMSSIKNPI